MKNIIEHTNARLTDWYANAKRDYGVIGHGELKFDNVTDVECRSVIEYTENGVTKEWEMWHYFENLNSYPIDYIFKCWMELT